MDGGRRRRSAAGAAERDRQRWAAALPPRGRGDGLACVGAALLAAAPAAPDEAPPPLVELRAAGGPVSAVAPPGELEGKPLRWPEPASGYGGDPAEWRR